MPINRPPSARQSTKPVSFNGFDHIHWLFVALCIGAVGYVFAAAWLVTAGSPDPIAHAAEYIEFLTTPWMIADYAVAIALIGFGFWYLRTSPRRAAAVVDVDAAIRRQGILLSICFCAAFASLVSIGYLYFTDLKSTTLAERSEQQEAVARLKSQQITKWLLERTIDAEFLATALRGVPLDRLSTDRDAQIGLQLLFAQLLAGNTERISVSLFAPDGQVLVHIGEGTVPDPDTVEAAKALAAQPTRRQSILDVHFAGSPPQPRMDFLVPVTERPGIGPTIAVVAMAINPFETLFPQITAWPTPSPSSELVVVRREGDNVVFITPPPLLKPIPLPLGFREPLATSKLPSAKAILQGNGVRIGPDYRGVEVLTASRQVSGMPWTVVAKTDLEELEHPLHRKQLTLMLVIGAAIILAAFLLIVLWRGEYASLLAFHDQRREERLAVADHFSQLTRRARDIVLLLDPNGLIVEANEAAVKAYGYTPEELMQRTHRDLRIPEDQASVDAQWRAAAAQGGVLFETVHRRKDGSTFPVEIGGHAIDVEGMSYRQAFIRDISQRKALEREIARLSRVRQALQAATSVLLRAKSETDLYEQICEILVHQASYRMANIAAPNDDAGRTVRYLAIAGADDAYLARAAISWGDGPRSHGPTGTALRTGVLQVNQDFANNPAVAPWRAEALKHGFRSSITLPLTAEGKVFAALTLYAEQPNAFDSEETAMLIALAEDVSYAVARLRQHPLTKM